MKTTAPITNATTQAFTEIQDIKEDVVLFHGGRAALIIEVSASNFSLLSREEQDAKITAYASFLNSLSFPLEILVVNMKVDISAYISLLENETNKIQDEHVKTYLQHYREFVQQLVKQNTVLDKRFYIVVPYSSYENTGTGAASDFFTNAKIGLHTKAEGLKSQLARINVQTKILQNEELIKIFTQFYNPELMNQQKTI